MNKNDIIIDIENNKDIEIKLESKQYSNLQTKTIKPITEEQIVEADSQYDALSKVIVQAVDPSEYYKEEESKNVVPMTVSQTIQPTENKVINEINVEAVTNEIDSNIQSQNILSGVSILGVQGNIEIPENYTGDYNITSNGTLPVANKKMAQDLIIEVPSIMGQYVSGNVAALTANDLMGATSIASYTFYNNIFLTSIICPSTITSIGNYAFANSTIKTVVLDSVTTIGNNAFYGCYDMTSIDLGDSLTTINYAAFSNCNKITNYNLPNTLTSIGNSAFNNNTMLTSIIIPSGVTQINPSVFNACTNLASITLQSTTVVTLSRTNAIPASASHTMTIYVPNDLISSYQTATNWSTLYNNGYITFTAIS